MKTFKEFNESPLDEGILDTVKNVVKSIGRGIGKTAVGAAKYGAQAIGAIPGGLIGGFKSGMSGGHGGGGGYGYGSKNGSDRQRRKIEQLKADLRAAKAGSKVKKPVSATPIATGGTGTPAPRPIATGGTGTPAPRPSATGGTPVRKRPPSGGWWDLTGTGTKPYSKAEKKNRRELARTSGGVTDRLGKIEPNANGPTYDKSFRAARTDPAKVKLAARGAELEQRRAAIQTTKGKLRKGVGKSDVKKFNVGQEVTKGNIIKQQSIAKNPEVAKRAAAARARVAIRKAGKEAPGSARSVMGAYESADLLNSVMKFLNK